MPGNSNSIWQGLRCPLILPQEKSESARVYFLWETVSILKLGGCRLGVKGEIQASSLGSLPALGASHPDMEPRGDENTHRVCLGSIEASGTNGVGTPAFT